MAQAALPVMNLAAFERNLLNTVKYKRLAHGKDTQVPAEVSEMLAQIGEMDPDTRRRIEAKMRKL